MGCPNNQSLCRDPAGLLGTTMYFWLLGCPGIIIVGNDEWNRKLVLYCGLRLSRGWLMGTIMGYHHVGTATGTKKEGGGY